MNFISRLIPLAKIQDSTWGRKLSQPGFVFAAQIVLSAIFLSLICNWHSFYEEDELAKAAQVTALARDANWFHFSKAADYYEKDLFSAYYLVATFFYKLTGLKAVAALNLFSVFCGTVFLSITPTWLRRVFGLPPWLTWIGLLNTPILVITFCYGNEAAFAITMVTLAAFALSFRTMTGLICGGIFYVFAAYGRSDYLLLFPALSLLAFVRKDAGIERRQSLRNLLIFTITAAVFGVAYLALVLRVFPKPELFEHITNFKLVAAFILYSPNPVNILLAAIGLGVCLFQRRGKYFFLLLVLLQALPYLTRLTTPKYILPSLVVVVVFAIVGMQAMLRRAPVLLVLLFAAPWVMALTPFGIFGPARSVYWYLPSDDGPIPTGGYLAFYPKVKAGFYQRRYEEEHGQIIAALPVLERQPGGADLVGYLNHQSFRLWAVENQRWDMSFTVMPFSFYDPDWISAEAQRAKYMLKTSYLYPFKAVPEARAKLDSCLAEGRIRVPRVPENGELKDPFPDFIEIGSLVPAGSARNLGKRILFFNQYNAGNQALRRGSFIRDFNGVSWIPRADFAKLEAQLPKPVYLDDEWVCFSEPVSNAVYYSLRFPLAYARLR